MARFYRKSIDRQVTGSRAELDAQRQQFQKDRLSGFFEIQSMPEELEVILFAGGEEVAAYRLFRNSRLKITSAEVGIGWDRQAVPVRVVALPDGATRALWNTLEFQLASQTELQGLDGLQKILDSSRGERLTGSLEVSSANCDGFLFFHEGSFVQGESAFCSNEGFSNNFEAAKPFLDGQLLLSVYTADPTTQAYRCILLRKGGAAWGGRILSTYNDMVGHKLLSLLDTNMNALLMHEQAKIHLADAGIVDNHFFCKCDPAVRVYRILFEDMAQLIGRVVGGMVTRRIMSSSFDRLELVEKEALKACDLTPSAVLK